MSFEKSNCVSWIPPEFSWVLRHDIFLVETDVRDPDLVEFISEGVLEVCCSPTLETLWTMRLLGDGKLNNVLDIAGQRSKHGEKKEVSYNRKEKAIYLHDVFILPDSKSVLVLCGFNEPVKTVSEKNRDLAKKASELFEIHKKSLSDFEKAKQEEEDRRNLLDAKHPELKSWHRPFEEIMQKPVATADSLVSFLPLAVHFDIGRFRSHTRISKEALSRIYDSGWQPPREGMYRGVFTLDEEGNKFAVVSWVPYCGLPAYPEVRSAVQKKLPSAFHKPRLNNSRPPLNYPIKVSNESDRLLGDDDEWEASLNGLQLDDRDYQVRIYNLREELESEGFEAIAWYQPFHVWSEESWGIYFDAKKLDDLSILVLDECRKQKVNVHPDMCAKLAFGLVHTHEIFHARVEAALTWLEMNVSSPRHSRYVSNVYEKLAFTESWLEEALANWSAYDWCVRFLEKEKFFSKENNIKIHNAVVSLLDMSPEGYDQWRKGESIFYWRKLSSQLVSGKSEVLDRNVLPLESILDKQLPYDVLSSDIPLFFVGEGVVSDRIGSHPYVINVPPRKELIRALRHFNYKREPSGGKGSHEKWLGPDNKAFILPRTDPVSRVVFKAFLDHFNIDKQTYAKNIRPAL